MKDQAQREKDRLVADATKEGFCEVRITQPDRIPLAPPRLGTFVEQGHHGTMAWMEERQEWRGNPAALWPDAKSIIMLMMNYGPDHNPLDVLEKKDKAAISVYAKHRDYHDIIKGKLKQIAGRLAARTKEDVKVFVDTAPVMEKPLAASAGLGWQGKHTNLVSRRHGSWTFLGSIFTTAELPPDEEEVDHCGSCQSCLDICPTDAFPGPYQLDARRCISYLTIEHKGPIDRELRTAMGNRIYGCDDCLAACPWNKFAEEAQEAKLQARDDLRAPALMDLLQLDDTAFRKHFSGSPIKRIGRDKFISNVLIALGNSGNAANIAPIRPFISEEPPLVRAMAVWALSRLCSASDWQQIKSTAMSSEGEPLVLEEWNAR